MRIEIQERVPLAPYTVYKIGGPSRFFAEARNADEMGEAFLFGRARSLNFFVLGAGSNTLISDKGFDGFTIHVAGGGIRIEGERIEVDAGVMMARVVSEAAAAGLTGFEWGIGIPGTIGGSIRGNAGCFGGEIKDVVASVRIINIQKSDFHILKNTECEFGYRNSIFKRHPEWVIVSATLSLKKGDPDAIREKIRGLSAERTGKQDIGTKSCGCIFKNVSWTRRDIDREMLLNRHKTLTQFEKSATIPAGFLIDECGLKGMRMGCVAVSPKHANFFVNEGGARAEEVMAMISLAKDAVRKKFGIILEEEIQFVGF